MGRNMNELTLEQILYQIRKLTKRGSEKFKQFQNDAKEVTRLSILLKIKFPEDYARLTARIDEVNNEGEEVRQGETEAEPLATETTDTDGSSADVRGEEV
jgi:hypothetical protein